MGFWIAAGYKPSPEQQVFHDACRTHRIVQVAGGVRAGKSYSLAMEIAGWLVTESGLIWLIGPDYEQPKVEFDYISEVLDKLGFLDKHTFSRPARGPSRLKTPWGCELQIKSASDVVALASKAPDAIGMSEAAQSPYGALEKAMERSAEKRAPIILSGTFESSLGWYADQWEEWQESDGHSVSLSLPSWSNRKVFPDGYEDEEIQVQRKNLGEEKFRERFGGIPCPPSGLVFKRFDMNLHRKPLADLYNPAYPIEVWADPATHTYAIMFVQVVGAYVHILDEIYAKDSIAQDIIPQVVKRKGPGMDKTWWGLGCEQGVIDAAGTRRAGGGQSQLQVWNTELESLGMHPIQFFWNEVRDVSLWYDAIHLRLHSEAHGGPLLYMADHLDKSVNHDGSARGIVGEFRTHRWREPGESSSDPSRPIKRNEDALSALGYGLLWHYGVQTEMEKQGLVTVRRKGFGRK